MQWIQMLIAQITIITILSISCEFLISKGVLENLIFIFVFFFPFV